MSKVELPLGKRTRLYRFFEILPGMISYVAVIALFVLSWVNPILGTIYLLLIVAITLVKAVATAFRTIQGYKVVRKAERVDWRGGCWISRMRMRRMKGCMVGRMRVMGFRSTSKICV